MKRFVPLLITILGGWIFIVAFFIPAWQESGEVVAVWFDILAAIAYILGGGNLLKVHLKKISDRVAGWGYSAVVILSFLLTLWVGLFKVGTTPMANTEFYGESLVPFPLAWMPDFSTNGTIPEHPNGTPLPASVRAQIRQLDERIIFDGWMTSAQVDDLYGYKESLLWQMRIERLSKQAQPPDLLRRKIRYLPDHELLAFKGPMSEEDLTTLKTLFLSKPYALEAIAKLAELSRRETRLENVTPPAAFRIPGNQASIARLDGTTLALTGPMSEDQRRQMAVDWTSPRRVRPFTAEERRQWIENINQHGPPLTESQLEAAEKAFNRAWQPEVLVQAINSAGVAPPQLKTRRELYDEQQAGVQPLTPEKPRGEDTVLNDAQITVVDAFAADPATLLGDFKQRLKAAGEVLPAQEAAIDKFLDSQPTLAEWQRDLARDLQVAAVSGSQRQSPLSSGQLNFLLADIRAAEAWEHTVNDLFQKSHVSRFPWSGHYESSGSPFWWAYTYIFQPVTATMFALLAFYVASAAFRAFRAKNLEAMLLLGTAFLMLLCNTYAGAFLTSWVPDSLSALRADELKSYIIKLFITTGNRAILIGIALGTAATSLKILLAVDRSYLGSGDEG